jgi:hypothetical protein
VGTADEQKREDKFDDDNGPGKSLQLPVEFGQAVDGWNHRGQEKISEGEYDGAHNRAGKNGIQFRRGGIAQHPPIEHEAIKTRDTHHHQRRRNQEILTLVLGGDVKLEAKHVTGIEGDGHQQCIDGGQAEPVPLYLNCHGLLFLG